MRNIGSLIVCVLLLQCLNGCGGMMGGAGAQQQQDMNLTGTLMRTEATGNTGGNYFLSGTMGFSYALKNVPANAADLVGKQVAVTGTMDTQSGGSATPTIIVKKIEVMQGAPAPQQPAP